MDRYESYILRAADSLSLSDAEPWARLVGELVLEAPRSELI